MSSPRSTKARRRKRKTRKEKVRAAERKLVRESDDTIARMDRLSRVEAGEIVIDRGARWSYQPNLQNIPRKP
jgi:hypothetical protein